MTLTYRLAEQEDKEMILEWLDKEHVRPYFHGEGLKNTIEDLTTFVDQKNSVYTHWIASHGDTSFAYLMTSEIKQDGSEDERFKRWLKGDRAITLDLLIGEENFLGKGLASPLIQSFLIENYSNVDEVFIDPEIANGRAVYVYERAGFEKLEEFIAPWNPVPHVLMRVKMKELQGKVI